MTDKNRHYRPISIAKGRTNTFTDGHNIC